MCWETLNVLGMCVYWFGTWDEHSRIAPVHAGEMDPVSVKSGRTYGSVVFCDASRDNKVSNSC